MFGYMLYYTDAMRPRGRSRTVRRVARARAPRPVRWALALAVVGAAIATGAAAETARIWKPNEAVQLRAGTLEAEASWAPLEGGDYEVTATLSGARRKRVVVRLRDGEAVTFSVPEHPGLTWRVARDAASVWPMRVPTSSGVTVSVDRATRLYAAR